MAASGSGGWFCYLLACADGTLYAGITTALERRLAAHNAGAASKYTRARRPVRLVWAEACTDRSAASRREAVVKALPRALKLALADARDRSDGDRAGAAAGAAVPSSPPAAPRSPRRRAGAPGVARAGCR